MIIICQLLLEINKFITITKYVFSLCRNIIMDKNEVSPSRLFSKAMWNFLKTIIIMPEEQIIF